MMTTLLVKLAAIVVSVFVFVFVYRNLWFMSLQTKQTSTNLQFLKKNSDPAAYIGLDQTMEESECHTDDCNNHQWLPWLCETHCGDEITKCILGRFYFAKSMILRHDPTFDHGYENYRKVASMTKVATHSAYENMMSVSRSANCQVFTFLLTIKFATKLINFKEPLLVDAWVYKVLEKE